MTSANWPAYPRYATTAELQKHNDINEISLFAAFIVHMMPYNHTRITFNDIYPFIKLYPTGVSFKL